MGKRGTMRKGQNPANNILWLILMIALFMIIYVILLPEADKEQFITAPGDLGQPTFKGADGRGAPPLATRTLLLSETPGTLYPFAQQLFVKPFASVQLFSIVEQREELLTSSLQIASSFFSGDSKSFTFKADPQNIDTLRLLFLVQSARGDITISVNGKDLFTGKFTIGDLPLQIPRTFLRATNTITFSVDSGVLGTNKYILRDIALFTAERERNERELRDFVLSQSQLRNLEGLTLYYFVNCFTVREKGTLRLFLNGNLLSQQLVVCDAGEVSQDLPLQDLIEGRNIIEFTIDNGKYVLEQLSLEGDTGSGRVPSYFFTLQVEDLRYGVPVGMEVTFYDRGDVRKVGTLFVNGFPLYLDTYADGAFFDITPYVVRGQNIIKILPETELEVVDLSVFLG